MDEWEAFVDVEKLKIKTVGIGNPPTVVGLSFCLIEHEQRKEFIQAWAKGVMEALEEAAEPLGLDLDTAILLEVSLGCGGATYRTADDIPPVDVPCPCGDPNHWLIRWQDCQNELLRPIPIPGDEK